MKQQMISRFPGISCACMDATGKETTEYYGVSDKEKNIAVDNDMPICRAGKQCFSFNG